MLNDLSACQVLRNAGDWMDSRPRVMVIWIDRSLRSDLCDPGPGSHRALIGPNLIDFGNHKLFSDLEAVKGRNTTSSSDRTGR